MLEPILKFLDIFFFVFHSVLILFNVFGWIVPKWRLLNLFLLSLTAFSWFILGIGYGWGYCFCTDWHWQIREMLGYQIMSSSYIHFLVLEITRFDLPVSFIDTATIVVFFTAFIISIYLNVRKWIRKNRY